MRELIALIREQVGHEELPFVIAQIGRSLNVEDLQAWQSIREQQRLLPDIVGHCAVVPTIDLGLDDTIHFSGASHVRFGKRLADAAWSITGGIGRVQRPIVLAEVRLMTNPWRGLAIIEVKFANVAGCLVAGSRPSGFALTSKKGDAIRELYNTELEGSIVRLKIYKTPDEVRPLFLNYGLGTDPYCNTTDELDRSLPVFGPFSLECAG